MKLDTLKKKLSDKKQQLTELEYDFEYCHSDSLRRVAQSNIVFVKLAIENLEKKIKELEKCL